MGASSIILSNVSIGAIDGTDRHCCYIFATIPCLLIGWVVRWMCQTSVSIHIPFRVPTRSSEVLPWTWDLLGSLLKRTLGSIRRIDLLLQRCRRYYSQHNVHGSASGLDLALCSYHNYYAIVIPHISLSPNILIFWKFGEGSQRK